MKTQSAILLVGLLVTLLAFPMPSGAQPDWPRHLVQDSFTPESAVSFDDDGDGTDEVFCVEASDGSVQRFSWNDGQWTQSCIYAPAGAGCDMETADIDLDGDQDLVVYDYILGLYWLEQDDDVWTQHGIGELSGTFTLIRITDLDDDGDQDVLSLQQFDTQLGWWENDLSGWIHHPISHDYTWIDDVTTGDMDSDGDADIVIASIFGLAWFEKDGDGWIEHVTGIAHAEDPLATGDFNGDGLTDVVAGGANFELMLHLQTATDWTTTTLQNNTINMRILTIKDLDVDGDLDLYVGWTGTQGRVYYVLNDGFAGFEVSPIVCSLNNLSAVVASDLNGDGFVDFTTTSEIDGVTSYLSEALFTWNQVNVRPGYGGSTSVAAADFSGTGQVDVAADFGSTEVRYWQDAGQEWTFQTVDEGEYWPDTDLAAIDMNQDGKFELVSAEYGLYELDCWEYADNTWNWLFPIYTDQVWINALEVADLDQDGDPDLLSGSCDGLVWCENQYGFFSPHWIFNSSMAHVEAIAAADMNGDGLLNPITIQNSGELNIWFEQGSSWSWQVVGLTEGGATAILPVNFDSDPELELITATHVSLQLWDRQPDLTWESSLPFAAIESATDLDQADFDGDEFRDILITSPDQFIWAEQNASGDWVTSSIHDSGYGGYLDTEVVDMDQDGDIDIVAVGTMNDLMWLENTGNTFVAHEPPRSMPQTTVLYPNHPNPFNPATQLTFALPRPGQVTLAVYDVTGREVARLIDGVMPAGMHRAMFDGTNLASGVYFTRLTGPDQIVQTQRLVLVK